MRRTAATIVGESLAALHDGPVFGVSGSGNFVAMETFHRLTGRYVAVNHEAAAVTMADGWAQVSGQVGVASLHQGPGFTNALTAIVDSAKERVPLVILAAELGIEDGRHHQFLDQAEVLRALGSPLIALTLDADDPARTVREGLVHAASNPATVVIRMPVRALTAPALAVRNSTSPVDPAESPSPRLPDVQRVRDLLSRARRPVILAGRGARSAAPELETLAATTGARVATTLAGDGLFSDSPRHIGFLGGFAAQATIDALADCDLILGFGTSLDEWTTVGGALVAERTVVSIAHDPPHSTSAQWIQADVTSFVRALGPMLIAASSADDAAVPATERHERRTADESQSPLSPESLFLTLNELLPGSRTIALDSGHFMAWAGMFLRARAHGIYLVGQGFQSVGLGLARGVGASLAAPDRVTVAVLGDGGFYMGLADLETAVRVGARLLVVVVNDSRYGAETHDFEPAGYCTDIVRFPPRDIAKAARGLGAHAVAVECIEDLRAALKLSVASGPLVLDCRVDATHDAAAAMTALGRAHWTGHVIAPSEEVGA